LDTMLLAVVAALVVLTVLRVRWRCEGHVLMLLLPLSGGPPPLGCRATAVAGGVGGAKERGGAAAAVGVAAVGRG
jgi:hypothetical protein